MSRLVLGLLDGEVEEDFLAAEVVFAVEDDSLAADVDSFVVEDDFFAGVVTGFWI